MIHMNQIKFFENYLFSLNQFDLQPPIPHIQFEPTSWEERKLSIIQPQSR